MAMEIRIKCTDGLNNIYYIYQRGDEWRCVSSNGTPASFSYAGILEDQMGVIFKLERCKTAKAALAVLRSLATKNYSFEIVGEYSEARIMKRWAKKVQATFKRLAKDNPQPKWQKR